MFFCGSFKSCVCVGWSFEGVGVLFARTFCDGGSGVGKWENVMSDCMMLFQEIINPGSGLR